MVDNGRGRFEILQGIDGPSRFMFYMEEGHWRSKCSNVVEYNQKKEERKSLNAKMPSASMVHIVEEVSATMVDVNIVMRARMVVKCATQTQAEVLKWPKQDKVCIQVVQWVAQEKPTAPSTATKLPPFAEEKVRKISFIIDLVFIVQKAIVEEGMTEVDLAPNGDVS